MSEWYDTTIRKLKEDFVGKPLHGEKPKIKVSITIDSALRDRALKRDSNLSRIMESALEKFLKITKNKK